MTKPYGVTIFCDDIREEEGGKRIIIGAYDDGMNVPRLPALVPSLAFMIKILEPISYKNRDGVLKILAPTAEGSEVVFSHALDPERWAALDEDDFDPEAEYVGSSYIIRASPFNLKAPGFMRVRAYYGEEEVKLGSIQVRQSD